MSALHAQIAAEQFAKRRARAIRLVELGKVTKREANRHARLWLAIAAAAGADLPELETDLIFPSGVKGKLTASMIADPADYLGELARARNVARDPVDAGPVAPKVMDHFWDLQMLALELGAPDHTLQRRDSVTAERVQQLEAA